MASVSWKEINEAIMEDEMTKQDAYFGYAARDYRHYLERRVQIEEELEDYMLELRESMNIREDITYESFIL